MSDEKDDLHDWYKPQIASKPHYTTVESDGVEDPNAVRRVRRATAEKTIHDMLPKRLIGLVDADGKPTGKKIELPDVVVAASRKALISEAVDERVAKLRIRKCHTAGCETVVSAKRWGLRQRYCSQCKRKRTRKQAKEWKTRNKCNQSAAYKAWASANRQRRRETNRRWRQANRAEYREKRRIYHREYYSKNKEKVRAIQKRAKAKKKASGYKPVPKKAKQ